MSNINAVANPLSDLWSRPASSSGPAPTPTTPPAPSAASSARPQSVVDAAYDKALDRLPSPSVGISAMLARLDPVGARLDQLQAAMKGPYRVNGATVYSGAQFRMAGGFNQNNIDSRSVACKTLVQIATKAGLASELPLLQVGRGSPEALVKVTQALIDAGELPAGSKEPLANQIHDLQWKFGIGVDCAGYVYRAVAAAYGDPAKLGLKSSGFENFTGLPSNAHFEPKDATEARAGDVIVLQGKGVSLGDPGHNLIVRSHATLAPESTSVTARWPEAAAFLHTKVVVHIYEVDSAFSAGEHGDPSGGVRRDVLLYNGTTHQWCTCKDTQPPVAWVGKVPYGEQALTGFFRPKGTP